MLIRPRDNIQPLETEKGIVHENYIGFGKGGISVKEWEEIKAHPDVEIAAPVASPKHIRMFHDMALNTFGGLP